MKATQTCPKCSGRQFAVTKNMRLLDYAYDNVTLAAPAVVLAHGPPPRTILENGGKTTYGRVESWICLACGFMELYAHAFDSAGFRQLAEQFPDQLCIVDAEVKSTGPFR